MQGPYQNADQWLFDNLERACAHLFPEGKQEGENFVVGNIAGKPGRSLSIALGPQPKRGIWKDFANGDKGSRNLPNLWKEARGFREIITPDFFKSLKLLPVNLSATT